MSTEATDVRQKLEDIQNEEQTEDKAPEQEAEPEYTEKEQLALDSGWNPDGSDKDGNTLNADEYMARKPLFNKIHNMKNDMDALRDQLKEVQGDTKKIAAKFIQDKENLVAQLKAAKEQALNDLDTDKVRQIDNQLDKVHAEVKEEAQAPAQQHSKQEWNSACNAFLKGNAWYDTMPGLKIAADNIGEEIANKGLSPDEFYAEVEKQIKQEFPDRFEEKAAPSKVSGSNRRGASSNAKSRAVTLNDIPYDEQHLYKTMAESSGKTIDEYLKTYKLEDFTDGK